MKLMLLYTPTTVAVVPGPTPATAIPEQSPSLSHTTSTPITAPESSTPSVVPGPTPATAIPERSPHTTSTPITAPESSTPSRTTAFPNSTPTSGTILSETTSQKKLLKSPILAGSTKEGNELDDSGLSIPSSVGKPLLLVEMQNLLSALLKGFKCVCKKCGVESNVTIKENTKNGLCTSPCFTCEACKTTTKILYSTVTNDGSKVLSINRRSVVANKCIGGTYSSLQMFCALMGFPSPVSKNVYTSYTNQITRESIVHAELSMQRARKEVRVYYGATSDEEVVDALVSVDGTWQKRGFSSLYGIVYVIEYNTGKVLDYKVFSKFCKVCSAWEKRKKDDEFEQWKHHHQANCDINFDGSAGAMEPAGILELFKRSLDYKIRYTSYISDGDTKSFAILSAEEPYGSDHKIEKMDCVGHVQKRLGTALRNLKTTYKGQKLSDGKTIGGQGRLTKTLIDRLQNYYGLAIRNNKENLQGMVRAVQAALQHNNSTDDQPRHNLCPTGPLSWCKYQKSKALGIEYHHTKSPIPEAILMLMKPVYNRLGNPDLLKKCLKGYTQNANEALHSLVWRFCPKTLFLGTSAVKCAGALAVVQFNDGVSSFFTFAESLGCEPTAMCKNVLIKRDRTRLSRSKYKESERAKTLRKQCRKRRKGLEEKKEEEEGGPMYASGINGMTEDMSEAMPARKRKK